MEQNLSFGRTVDPLDTQKPPCLRSCVTSLSVVALTEQRADAVERCDWRLGIQSKAE